MIGSSAFSNVIDHSLDPFFAAITAPQLAPLFWPGSRVAVDSAWYSHVPFGHWVVAAAQPHILVELGTHAGVSYFAFCEAVARLQLDTRCLAIDTWEGDLHSGFYGHEIFTDLKEVHDARYGAFSELLRTTFDNGLSYVSDGSVDLLHIDGRHLYEDVRHDFLTWKPKLSPRAVVLFHDTNVRERDFGVWRLWNELSQSYPSFELLHGHGLGVVAVGQDVAAPIAMLCGTRDVGTVAAIRERFALFGKISRLETQEIRQQRAIENQQRTIENQQRTIGDQQGAIERQQRAVEDQQRELEGQQRILQEQNLSFQANERARIELERELAKVLLIERELQSALGVAQDQHRENHAVLAETRSRLEQAHRERDLVIHSRLWRFTWPLRVAANLISPSARKVRGD